MNQRLLPLLAICALIPCGTASGALLIGFNSFTADTTIQQGGSGANYLAPVFSGFYDPADSPSKTATGGSTDGTYGNITVGESTPGVDNGYVTINNTSTAFMELTNESGATVVFDQLLFDAVTISSVGILRASYRYGTTGDFTSLGISYMSLSYKSFSRDISSLQLENGQTIQFKFTGNPVSSLDNFAITSIPEPATTVITGALLALGACRRRRAGLNG